MTSPKLHSSSLDPDQDIFFSKVRALKDAFWECVFKEAMDDACDGWTASG